VVGKRILGIGSRTEREGDERMLLSNPSIFPVPISIVILVFICTCNNYCSLFCHGSFSSLRK
jgi:hypothetical protein